MTLATLIVFTLSRMYLRVKAASILNLDKSRFAVYFYDALNAIMYTIVHNYGGREESSARACVGPLACASGRSVPWWSAWSAWPSVWPGGTTELPLKRGPFHTHH